MRVWIVDEPSPSGNRLGENNMSDKNFELSRRKALIGLGTVGAASAGAGFGTSAYFSDGESFDGNTIQAGEFGLTVEQQVHGINQDGIGPDEEDFDAGVSDDGIWIQDPITIEDAKPGDEYEFCWEITVEDNPGYVALAACYDDWTGVEADNVELDDLWDIDDESNLSTIGDETLVDAVTLENGGSASYSYGTVGELLSDLRTGALLDDGGTPVEFGPGETWTLCVELSIPTEVGNELQGALLEWDLAFYAEQARHNDGGGVADRAADSIVCEEGPDRIATWTEVGDIDEAGGPVILMGLDSELGAGRSSHGPPEEHAAMVDALMDSVSKDHDDSLLVIGISGSSSQSYWEDDIVANVDALDSVTFVNGAESVEDENFDDYAMIGVGSSDNQISGGLTDQENVALDERSDDIADFVNQGGALLGKTQNGLDRAWEYVDPFGDFNAESTSFSSIQITQEGIDLGLTQDGMDGWCCYHEVILNFPDFFDVLLEHDDGGDYQDEAAAIGGEEVIVEREVSLAITGLARIASGETASYDVEIENRGDETIEGEFEIDVVDGDVTVSDDLPASVELDSGESESFDDAIDVTCNSTGETEIAVELVDVTDGTRLVEVTMNPECV